MIIQFPPSFRCRITKMMFITQVNTLFYVQISPWKANGNQRDRRVICITPWWRPLWKSTLQMTISTLKQNVFLTLTDRGKSVGDDWPSGSGSCWWPRSAWRRRAPVRWRGRPDPGQPESERWASASSGPGSSAASTSCWWCSSTVHLPWRWRHFPLWKVTCRWWNCWELDKAPCPVNTITPNVKNGKTDVTRRDGGSLTGMN